MKKKFAINLIFVLNVLICLGQALEKNKMNVLLITADDLNCNSIGAYGCMVDNITPNIDKLASEGLRFTHAHVTVAVCQPSRGVLATGRYPHNSGILGFFQTQKEIPTIVRTLKNEGYRCGILGKSGHSSPRVDTPWDTNFDQNELGFGRDKDIYYARVRKFIQESKEVGKPFYLMVNSHDPHRPFAGSDQEKKRWANENIKAPSRTYKPEEIVIPGFLPELPQIRTEIAEYFSSVKRFDDTIGKILQALGEEGVAENTLVMFLSDNGIAVPFAKTNCYLNSTNTPWLVKWPGVVKSGSVDEQHFISGIDFFPTVLDAIGIKIPNGLDGKSFVPILEGKKQKGRKNVFTQFHETSARNSFPMRCVQDKKFGYIFNAWANGEKVFKNESQGGYTWKAMIEAANHDQSIANRVEFFSHRVVEEFYDFEKDPNALNNLIDDPKYKKQIDQKQLEMEKYMRETGDFILEAYLKRDDAKFMEDFVNNLQTEAKARRIQKQ